FGGRDENVVKFAQRMLAKSPPLDEVHYKEGWPSLAGAPDSVAVMSPARPVLNPRWSTLDGDIASNPDINTISSFFPNQPRRASQTPTKVLLREGRVIFIRRVGNKNREMVVPAMIHPIVVGKTVLYRAARGVVAIDLPTGETWETIDFPLFHNKKSSGSRRVYYGSSPSMRIEDRGLWTVTAGGGRVFAIGGFPQRQAYYVHMGWGRSAPQQSADTSVLTAFSISNQGRMLWQIGGGEGDSALIRGAKFLTAPTYVAGRLYTIVEYTQSHYLVCLNAENGRMVWETMIAQMPMQASRYGRYRNNRQDRTSPPAVSGGKVFVVTNAGVIAAFDTDTGRSLWAYQYQRNLGLSVPPNPIVVTRGRAICLPADCGNLLALQTDTGRLDWSVDRRNQRDLTAVDGSRLLLSGDGMIVIDAVNGQDVWKAEELSGVHGRPAVTTDSILASGRGEIIRVSLADFSVSRPPLVDSGSILGNLICVDGKMIAANAAGLSAYFAFEDTHTDLTDRIKKVPPEKIPDLLYRRAVNAFSAGHPQIALVDLLKTRQAAEERGNNVLLSKTSQMLYRTYVSLADHKASNSSVMLDLYNKAHEYAYSDRSRGEMLMRLAKYYSKNGAVVRAVELAHEVTEKYPKVDLADVQIGADADGFVRDTVDTKRFVGYELGNRMIKDLISRHGRECYSVFDTKAASALTDAVASDDPDAMVRVADTYRHSTSAPLALLRAAESRYRQALRLKSPADRKSLSLAGRDIARLMREYRDSGLNASAELGMAMIYQRVSPRLMWLGLRGLETLSPDIRASFADVSGQTGDILKRLTAQLPPPRTITTNLPGPITAPLKQIFRGPKSEATVILRGDDGQPVRCDESLFLLFGGGIIRFNPAAATFEEAIQWKTAAVMDTRNIFRTSTPYVLRSGLTDDSTVLVVAFHRGGIIGADAKTGKVLWRRSSSEKIVSRLHSTTMGGNRLVVQTYEGKIIVLDMHNGKETWEGRVSSGRVNWSAPPQITSGEESSKSGGILLVSHSRGNTKQAVAFDMSTGKLLGRISMSRNGQAHLTPEGLILVCNGKSLRLIEPVLGIDRSIWSIDMPSGQAIIGATDTHVIVSPAVGSNVVELRSLTDNGRIVRTFQCKSSTPIGAVIVGNRLYVITDTRAYLRHLPVTGRISEGMAATLNAFELTSARMLWSADLMAQPARSVRTFIMPLQVGQNHLCTTIKERGHRNSPVAMIIETTEGKIVQKLTLPDANGINRAQRYARSALLSSPAITAGRLVVETHNGLEVYGKQ
ncbi:MAG: PQQ-binding-like beta-propeller repeat protein, partial [Phycisphaerae bacterium]|nr:PQQ-binding-like beta-propeller repeat protein [Phycisphaerae bacterium]